MNKRVARVTGPVALEELNQATQVIVRSTQNECFPEDVIEEKKSSKLANLRPVLVDGTLRSRVGGRSQKATALSWDD